MPIRVNKRLIQDYLLTFGSPEGKRVLDDLAKHCPLLRDALKVSSGVDTHKVMFYEGQRSVLLHIYKMRNRDPNEEAPPRAVNQLPTE